MLSIPGVGKVVSWTMIAKTEGFKKITDPRKMACYSGVVPFEHQSGTSVYRKPRVSMFADKDIKSILHLAAMSAIRLKNDLQCFYHRKVKEGKNKMSVLNAVRNKIIHLIFAIIKSFPCKFREVVQQASMRLHAHDLQEPKPSHSHRDSQPLLPSTQSGLRCK